MEHRYLSRQTSNKPLFPDLIWDKPESKLHAGKLLVIGGNAHSFSAAASAFAKAAEAGAGVVKVLLPEILKKSVGSVLENGEFAPSNKSGSFNKKSLAVWLDFAAWSDGVLLPGDMGRNSETAIVLEQFVDKYRGLVTVTQDTLEYFVNNPLKILERTDTIAVLSFAQLQKIAINSRFSKAFTFDMPVANMADNLHLLTTMHPLCIVLRHNGIFYVAKDGDVSTTQTNERENFWRVATAAKVSVWAIQNPSKTFAALTSAIYEITKTTE